MAKFRGDHIYCEICGGWFDMTKLKFKNHINNRLHKWRLSKKLRDLEYYYNWDRRGTASEEKMDFFDMMNEEEESRQKITKMELLHDLEYYSKWDIRGIASEEKMDFFNMMNEEEESRQKITKMELLFKSGICYDLSKLIISYI